MKRPIENGNMLKEETVEVRIHLLQGKIQTFPSANHKSNGKTGWQGWESYGMNMIERCLRKKYDGLNHGEKKTLHEPPTKNLSTETEK